jgi:predicted metalloendopeptidase
MVRFLNSGAGELLGKVYCQKYFPESSKQAMLALVKVNWLTNVKCLRP